MAIPDDATAAQRFDALFRADDDPWRYASSAYERRKRSLMLGCLPLARYERAFEPGCANGVLTAALAARCARVVAWDAAGTAVALARRRLADAAHVQVEARSVPHDWPDGAFDLIVVSEFAYYLSASDLDAMLARIDGTLTPDGTVLACHWRWPIPDGDTDGDGVHARLAQVLAMPRVTQLVERDFRIDVWCRDERTPAQREGLAPIAPRHPPSRPG